MAGNMRAAAGGLLAGLFCWGICGGSPAQDPSARPEVVPAPTPKAVPQQHRPQMTYGPLQAGQDAYRMAEQQRLQAVDRQLDLVHSAWWYHRWAVPYVPTVPHVYAYGYAYRPRLGFRRAYRYGYHWAVPQPWPSVPGGVYVYPYSAWARQPTGYEQIWTGPNSYIYRPYYGQPTQRPSLPTPSPPSGRPEQPPHAAPRAGQRSGPALNGPIQPAPEPIPTPSAEPAP